MEARARRCGEALFLFFSFCVDSGSRAARWWCGGGACRSDRVDVPFFFLRLNGAWFHHHHYKVFKFFLGSRDICMIDLEKEKAEHTHFLAACKSKRSDRRWAG